MGYVTPGEAVGTFTDIGTAGLINGHQYANVGVGTGIVAAAGVTSAGVFEADVAASGIPTDGHVIAAVFGGNTVVAEFEWTGGVSFNHVEFVTLVGVVATSVSLTGGVTGSIHIA
jgi:hypothetical protein